ncbi:Pex19 protein [Teratosphaeria nubilosa]|uniref:Pex19 protein n=1 Tax=Teratosphaeria nubilosa TaxID=161662 RepID=A0A6G1LGE2_9PEZI|nr:Pex19 protein [Teratosphaeria nubilosa]
MQGLISELDENPKMQKQFEQMMQELIAAGAAPSDQEAGQHLKEATQAVPAASKTSEDRRSGPAPKKDDFNDTIRRTMERMQQSDASATSGAQSSGQSEEDMIAQMLKDLQGGEGGEEDFNKMLLQMMSQLTNKEILYDPMKELHEKFPGWMVANAEKTSKEDLERYKEQQKLVGQIVERFERSGYSDDNEEDRDYIVDKMQKMQAAGSPPPDLVGDMKAAQEALGDLDQGCPTQ